MLTLQFIVLQIIVFSVIVYFQKKILGGDTENAVKRLSLVYEDLIKKQKDLSEKIADAEKEFQAKKEESATIADKLANQAMDEAHKKEDELLKKARAEAEDILAKAHGSKEQFRHELEIEANKKMVDFAAGLIGSIFDEKTKSVIHEQFIRNFIEQAKQSDLASVDLQGRNPEIRTAIAFKKEEKEQLQQVLATKLGKADLQIEEVVDEKLIAGVALVIGTLVVDSGFATALKEASVKIKEKIQTT